MQKQQYKYRQTQNWSNVSPSQKEKTVKSVCNVLLYMWPQYI